MENFNRPYLALTPSEFWNRWHISLSSWLRDYIFFPLRRTLLRMRTLPEIVVQSIPPLVTMFVSGLWHGVGWKFIVWGLYYGVLIVIYQLIGVRGDWRPTGRVRAFLAWLVMFGLIVFGWLIFRAPTLGWLWNVLIDSPFVHTSREWIAGFVLLVMIAFYASLLMLKLLFDLKWESRLGLHALYYTVATLLLIVFMNSSSPDFIYFQF
jgi:D-alanyl-lipoteichoic acid acyltransferase DltB (MBOAT superfamily)